MVKRILIGALILFAGATTQASEGYLVSFMDATCGACKALHDQEGAFKANLKRYGLTLHYAPVPQSGNAETAWRERVYYVTRELVSEEKAQEVLSSYFDAQGDIGEKGEPLVTKSQVEAWLGLKIDGVDWRRLISDIEQQSLGIVEVNHSINLFLSSGANSFPAFAVVRRGEFIPVTTSGDLEQKLKQLDRTLLQMFKK